jgi:uncharacterized protein YbbK (DUF523 family)
MRRDLSDRRYLVSACLAGLRCRYKGDSCAHPHVVRLVREGKAVPVCPEQAGGLCTPRPPACIVREDKPFPSKGWSAEGRDVLEGRAKVLDANGRDVSPRFLRGAEECLRAAKLWGIDGAILKSGSPSCGSRRAGDPEDSFVEGVAAALLKKHGIEVISEKELPV